MGKGKRTLPKEPKTQSPRFSTPKLRTCGKDLSEQALEFIPKAKDFSTAKDYTEFLSANLPFNSESTRRRNAEYLVNRFFSWERNFTQT